MSCCPKNAKMIQPIWYISFPKITGRWGTGRLYYYMKSNDILLHFYTVTITSTTIKAVKRHQKPNSISQSTVFVSMSLIVITLNPSFKVLSVVTDIIYELSCHRGLLLYCFVWILYRFSFKVVWIFLLFWISVLWVLACWWYCLPPIPIM